MGPAPTQPLRQPHRQPPFSPFPDPSRAPAPPPSTPWNKPVPGKKKLDFLDQPASGALGRDAIAIEKSDRFPVSFYRPRTGLYRPHSPGELKEGLAPGREGKEGRGAAARWRNGKEKRESSQKCYPMPVCHSQPFPRRIAFLHSPPFTPVYTRLSPATLKRKEKLACALVATR
jgi:hypothetical protein